LARGVATEDNPFFNQYQSLMLSSLKRPEPNDNMWRMFFELKEYIEYVFESTKIVKLGYHRTDYATETGNEFKASVFILNRTTQLCPSFEQFSKNRTSLLIRKGVYPKGF